MSHVPPMPSLDASAADANARRQQWQRRLPRLRLDAEPIDQQLLKLRNSTRVLSVVVLGIGVLFFVLFSLFGSPVVGLIVGGVLFGSVVTPAWRSFYQTRDGAAAYLRELGNTSAVTKLDADS